MSRLERPFLARGAAPLNIAHRGGAEENPESTMLAFRHAVERARADILELDVWLTRDEEVVVFHDDHIDRTTDGEGLIRDSSLQALQRLDAAYGFEWPPSSGRYPHRGSGLWIPTLEEILTAFPEVRINIDLKDDDTALASAVLDILRRLDAYDRVCLGSFHDSMMRWVAAKAPERICLSAPPEVVAEIVYAAQRGRDAVADVRRWAYDVMQIPRSMYGLILINRPLVEAYHRAGWNVHVWTINAPEDWKTLCGLDVDGIVTDRPSALGPFLKP